jgi:hypothetical protein
VPIDQQLAWIIAFRRHKLLRIDAYSSAEEALEAAEPPHP